MNRLYLLIRCFLPAVACIATAATGQSSAPANPTTEEVARQAGLVFTGVVTAVDVPEATPTIAQISFRVTEGIRGVNTGEPLIIREWTGTWNGHLRYRLGEKVLAFFYTAGANGVSSPVGGPAGIFRFANDSTLKLNEAQQTGILRSPRLRDSLESAGGHPPQTVPAETFLRALRLVADSP